MLKKEREFSNAYELSKKDVDEHIESTYGIQNFSFGIHEDELGDTLVIDEKDAAVLIRQNILSGEDPTEESLDLETEQLEDYAHDLLQIVTGDELAVVALTDGGRKLLCLAN